MAETKNTEYQEKTAINMPGHLPLYGSQKIDHDKLRYPHCIVWTPIPCLTWVPYQDISQIDSDGPVFLFSNLFMVENNLKHV